MISKTVLRSSKGEVCHNPGEWVARKTDTRDSAIVDDGWIAGELSANV